MERETYLLSKAGPWRLGGQTPDLGEKIERIELRTDGHGVSGFYDVIYLYVEGREEERAAMPAHMVDCWEYL